MTTSILVGFLAIGLLCVVSAQPAILSQSEDADARANKAVNAVASQIREQAGVGANIQLIPVSYAIQIVSNQTQNLFVKIRLGKSRGAKVVHAKIMEGPSGDKWNLNGLKQNVGESARIEIF